MSTKSNEKAKRPRIVPTLEIAFKFIAVLKLANEESILDVNMEYCLQQ
jgi:hypothetical protein